MFKKISLLTIGLGLGAYIKSVLSLNANSIGKVLKYKHFLIQKPSKS